MLFSCKQSPPLFIILFQLEVRYLLGRMLHVDVLRPVGGLSRILHVDVLRPEGGLSRILHVDVLRPEGGLSCYTAC